MDKIHTLQVGDNVVINDNDMQIGDYAEIKMNTITVNRFIIMQLHFIISEFKTIGAN